MANPSPYEAEFPAMFVDWAASKIERAEVRLKTDASLTDSCRQGLEADISYLKGAIERIAGLSAQD